MQETPETPGFAALGLNAAVLDALTAVGYESPSPIQAATIPLLLAGRDVLGQAQTGTGKTAAFALPILNNVDLTSTAVQALVLTPTRELAIQVAEAFQRYAVKMPGFSVLPIYGGQSYGPQLGALKRGVHVVVGTPGRVIDHLDRGSLKVDGLRTLVLDEGDEMLRMGFIDDVEKVLGLLPESRQIALFSATMPPPIRRIANTHLRDPAEVTIASKTTTAANIRQRYWWVSGLHKLDALTRILEAEEFEAMIIFARTKLATEELAERLQARGFAAEAINGDLDQKMRERMITRLRDGQLDILVATDVAARGLDVDRISHVLNYDIPYDAEAYVHRIGRTGRAGRAGEAILFVTPREKGMLRIIERTTRQPIEEMRLPSVQAVNDRRVAKFMQQISDTRAAGGLEEFAQLIESYVEQNDVPAIEVAAALARLAHGEQPLKLSGNDDAPRPSRERREADGHERSERPSRTFEPRGERPPRSFEPRGERPPRSFAPREERPHAEGERAPRARREAMETYRVEVGYRHGVEPRHLVGAIANEAGLDNQYIGRIEITDDASFVDLPPEMPEDVLEHLRGVMVLGQRLNMSRADGPPPARTFKPRAPRGDGPRGPRDERKAGPRKPPRRG